jgi:putative ABC transport system ATP-binding protein
LVSVSKVYGETSPVTALRDVSLALAAGSFTSVMGPSGSGKTTLLQCAAGLDEPTSGQVFVDGAQLPQGDEAVITEFRRGRIGFVFQQYNLIPYLTVAQNLALPLQFAHQQVDRHARSEILGQQQRVAIARALLAGPTVLFADEPTGAMDSASGHEVLAVLREAVDAFGQTVMMVTHDASAAACADAVIFLVDGVIVDRLQHPSAAEVAEWMTRQDARGGGGR